MAHRLTLIRSVNGPGFVPSCTCGWAGLPRSKATAEGEYRAHRRHLDDKRAHGDWTAPRPLTPFDDLPEPLRAPHPDLAPYDEALDAVVARLSG